MIESMMRLDQIESSFDEAVFVDGLPIDEVNAGIRRLYGEGERSGTSFSVMRAKMLAYALGNARLAVNKQDAFAGVVERHYLDGRYGIGEIARIQSERAEAVANRDFPDDFARTRVAWDDGRFFTQADLSHTSPDWDRLLAFGIPGLIAEAEQRHAAHFSPFTESVVIACHAFHDFALRFAAVCDREGRQDLATELSSLAARPPETLHEALQLAILYWHVQEIEGEWVRSWGIFDRQYLQFLERDIAAGHLTEEGAEELLVRFFGFLYAESKGCDAGAPFCFGGYLPGEPLRDGCNRLTRIAWRAFRTLGTPSPKFSLRVNPDTPPELLRFAAGCIQEGKNAMVFTNEPIVRKAMLRRGKDQSDLANFIPIGCYEPAVMGRELSCTMTCVVNLAKPVEDIVRDDSFVPDTFAEFESRYFAALERDFRAALGIARKWELAWRDINPSPILSATMADCVERGLDVSEFGTKYATSGVVCAGLATAVDSLLALRTIVFDRRMLSPGAFRDILRADWTGREDLRQFALRRTPKWGGGDADADALGQRICATAADIIEHAPSAKPGGFQMGLWSIDWCLHMGSKMGATPDGRRAGTPVSKNSGASFGCDAEGPAGVVESLSHLDHARFPDGAVFDVMLPRRTIEGEDGVEFLAGFVRAFFAKGGQFVHFNSLSPEMLREAQRNPAKYRNLQVRLCGWNVRFVDLDLAHQNWVIAEAEGRGK